MVMADEADIGFHAATEFCPFSPEIEIVSGNEGAAEVGDFPDAAEVVFSIVIESRIAATNSLFTRREKAFRHRIGRRIALFRWLISA